MKRDRAHWLKRFGRWTRLHLLRALRENSTPARTALGFGLGAFIGIAPSFLIGSALAFYLAHKIGLNRAAAVAGTIIMNPLTAPIFYSLSAWMGRRIFAVEAEAAKVEGVLSYLREYGLSFLVGNTVVAFSVAIVLAAVIFVIVSRMGRRGLRGVLVRPRSSYRPVSGSGTAS